MTKNTLLLLFLSILSGGLYSCHSKIKADEIPVDLCSVELDLIDNTFASPQLAAGDTVEAKAFGLRAVLNYVYDGNICRISPLETFSFFPACYASSSPDARKVYVSTERIDSIAIITTNYFDAGHPAGSNVAGCFSVFEKFEFHEANSYFFGYRSINLVSEYTFPLKEEVNLLLKEMPEYSGDFQFTIRFFLNNGDVLESVASQIHLNI